MPIPKNDAFIAAAERDTAIIDDLCTQLDEAIEQYAGTPTLITVSVEGVSPHIVKRIIKLYAEIGWECSLTHDVHEGDHLILV